MTLSREPGYFIDKLTDDNYSVWKFKIEQLLIKEGSYNVVFDETPNESEMDAAWCKRDRNSKALICLNISDSQIIHVLNAKSARETWDNLKTVHERISLTNKFYLLRKLYSAKYDESTKIQEHIKGVLELAEKLKSVGEEIKENHLIAILMCSLPNSYSTLITAIEGKNEEELSLKYVKNKLVDEYTRRMESKQIQSTSHSHAFKGNSVYKSFPKTTKYCTYCHKNNHTKNECFHLQNKEKLNTSRLNKPEYKRNVQGHRSSICKQETQSKLSKDKSIASDHEEEEVERDNNYQDKFVLKIQETLSDNLEFKNWILDSGASCHMTGDINFYAHMEPQENQAVIIANGTKLQSTGIGTGYIETEILNGNTNNIKLENVLYVPRLDCNLLSVRSITKKGCIVVFEGDSCTIKRDNIIIANASIEQGLYKLTIKTKHKALKVEHTEHSCLHNNCIMKWHQRLGHRSIDGIKQIQKQDLANGLKLNNCRHSTQCCTCTKAKLTELPYPKKTHYRAVESLQLIHTDVCGPVQLESIGGKLYFITFIDDFSRYTHTYLMSSKEEVFEKLKEYVASTTNKFGKKIKTIRYDNGTEYCNQAIENYLKGLGIDHQRSVPYSPAQNGVAERKNRSLMEMARAMLINSKLPKTFWGEAVATATYLQNRLPTKATNQIPYEMWNGRKPSLGHLRVFGCKAYMYVHKQKRRKLDDKAVEGVFVGYDPHSKGYRIYIGGRKISVSRSVRFDEQNFSIGLQTEESHDSDMELMHFNLSPDENNIEENEENYQEQEGEDFKKTQGTRVSTRATKGIPPVKLTYKVQNAFPVSSHIDPKSFQELVTLPKENQEKWMKAMKEEMKSLEENETWELTDLPKGKSVIGNKWIFKTKCDEKGREVRCKARLVVKGFSQKYGTDYDETFSPVVKHTTIRVFLACAAFKRAKVHHIDIKTAFLYGKLSDEIYMSQPEGFKITEKDKVCKLRKSIYGLKQAARCWNQEIQSTLEKLEFVQSKADPCLFTKGEKENRIYLILYVDDILISSVNEKDILEVIQNLKKNYQITDLGEAKFFLGIEISRTPEGDLLLSQQNKIEELIKKLNLEDAKPCTTPMETNYYQQDGEQNLLSTNEQYRQAIGSLLYISSVTRPDIATSTHILSRRCENPRQKDWSAVKRIVKYLKTTKTLALSVSSQGKPTLQVYSDADWAQDREDRKSTSGSVCFLGKNCISWSSKKQNCVSLSSAEAEYIALSQSMQELLWLLKLLDDVDLPQELPIRVYEDNQSTIKLVESEKYSVRTKHIDTKYHHVRDLQSKNIIHLSYLPTQDMVGDIMTKPLPKTKFELCRRTIMPGANF